MICLQPFLQIFYHASPLTPYILNNGLLKCIRTIYPELLFALVAQELYSHIK